MAFDGRRKRRRGRRRTLDAIRWVTEPSIRWLHVAPKAKASLHQSNLFHGAGSPQSQTLATGVNVCVFLLTTVGKGSVCVCVCVYAGAWERTSLA